MPTLLQRPGAELVAQIYERLTRCRAHGHQPWVLACPCVLSGTEPGASSMDGVFCAAHLRGFADQDPAADDDLEATCLACLRHRGLIGLA